MSTNSRAESSPVSVTGDVAFVTGAGSGIGLALTKELVKLGAKVIMVDINEEACKAVAKELNKNSESAVAVTAKADVRSWEEQLKAYETGVEAFGRVDYFIANAGISEGSGWLPPSPSPSSQPPPITKPNLATVETNLLGALYTSALALQVFDRQPPHAKHGFRGKLVLTASIYSYWACASGLMYAGGKAGVLMFMRSMARMCEMTGRGITVNSVAPNLLATGLGSPESLEIFRARGLLKTSMDLVVRQYISVLGESKDNGRAISICGDEVWDHPVEMTKWEVNKETLDLLEHLGGVGVGLWNFDPNL
ncbi:hypothetical protein V5O48_003172 [Marasmius crinis-equi]|uniref:Uncharacterized protein n=1 Tax=Marasmius crinis-equi TaxID=585013 RepID=A0ABR3FUP6_9AGAR